MPPPHSCSESLRASPLWLCPSAATYHPTGRCVHLHLLVVALAEVARRLPSSLTSIMVVALRVLGGCSSRDLEVQGGPRQQALEDGTERGLRAGAPNWGVINQPTRPGIVGDSLVSPQHMHAPSQTPEHPPSPTEMERLGANPQAPSPTRPVCSSLGSHSSPDHPPRHHGEGWELGSPFFIAAGQGQRRRAMSAISTCHSPPQPGHSVDTKAPLYLHQLGPGLFLPHCQGITKAERDTRLHSETGRLRFKLTG